VTQNCLEPRTNSGVPESRVMLGIPRSAAVLMSGGIVFRYWRVTMSYLCRRGRIQSAGKFEKFVSFIRWKEDGAFKSLNRRTNGR
jgi:hypothetical protein